MIKNALHVFYTRPQQGSSFFGFPDIRYFYMSVYLSLKCLKDKGYHTKLVTDELGKKYLIDNFGMPYDEVTTELEHAEINPFLWGMAKMYAFSIQKEPFIYVDLDAFLFKDIDYSLKTTDIFFQNREKEYYTAWDTFSRFRNYFVDNDIVIREYWNVVGENRYGDAYNTAVFGGNDLDLIKRSTEAVINYTAKNMAGVNDKYIGDRLSVFMEQVYLLYYLKFKKLVHIKQDITERLDYYKVWHDDYVHLVSYEKFNLALLAKVHEKVLNTSFETLEKNSWGVNYEDLLLLTK